jgi:hypothetical protein
MSGLFGSLFSSSGSFTSPASSGSNLGNITGNYIPIIADDLYTSADPQNSWMWTADLYAPGLNSVNRVLIADIMVPFQGFNTETRFRGGFTYNFPKFINLSGGVNITFHETQTFEIIAYILKWMDLVCDSKGNYGVPSDYMGYITVTLFDTSGIPAFQYELLSVWPERPTDWNLGFNSTLLQTVCLFSASRAEVTYMGSNILDSPIANLINPNSLANSAKSLAGSALPIAQGLLTSTLL